MLKSLARALVVLAAPAAAQDAPPGLSINYACTGGAVLQVAYINVDPDRSFAVLGWAGRLIPMQAGPTGSGVRYVALDGPAGYVWHSKGSSGTLLITAADPAAEEQTVLSDCEEVAG